MQTTHRRIRGALATIAGMFLAGQGLAFNSDGHRGALHVLGPVAGAPGTVAVWVLIDYPMSVECSPPRACYAKSQWMYAFVNCPAVLVLQQLSLDLNGNVVAVANADPPQLVPGYGYVIRSPIPGAAGKVYRALCAALFDAERG